MKHRYSLAHKFSIILMIISFCGAASAQPKVKITGIKLFGAETHVTPRFYCGFDSRGDVMKINLLLRENGNEIKNYDFDCYGGGGHCCASCVILIDKSQYMSKGNPTALDSAKLIANAFVDAMDGNCDEASLMSFSKTTTLDAFMATDKILLKNGIDAIKGDTSSLLWDAAYKAIEELMNNGTQECRGVIVISSGQDDHSIHTRDEVIAFAKANKAKIHTVGYGQNVVDENLSSLADSTGGRYSKYPGAAQGVWYYKELTAIIAQYWCQIIYTPPCIPDTIRKVEIIFKNLLGCPGVDTASASYIKPFDSTYIPVVLKLDSAVVQGGGKIGIPLTLKTKLSQIFPSATCKIKLNTSFMTLDSVITKYQYLQDVSWKTVSSGYEFSFPYKFNYETNGLLATLWFTTKIFDVDTKCKIELTDWIFEGGCFVPELESGEVTILGKPSDIKQLSSPASFYLGQNYPNPFDNLTIVDLPLLVGEGRGEVLFKVYDIFGREILDLSDKIIDNSSGGSFGQLTIDNSQLPYPGIYFYRLTVGCESQTKMMILIK